MRKITIVGAGQSGLHLGIGLLGAGYEVRIVSNRSADEIENGRVTSSQVMFGGSRVGEAMLGLDFWRKECPSIDGVALTVSDGKGNKFVDWSSRLDLPAQSVDQRVKMPRWIREFTSRGGSFVVRDASIDDLEEYARNSDLVVIAAGKGEIAKMFERDASRSRFDTPQRTVSVAYVRGMEPRKPYSAIPFHVVPGVGEYFTAPALTTSGSCDFIAIEGVLGGPWDVFRGLTDPEQHLDAVRKIVNAHLPWEAERCRNIELTDPLAVLAGAFASTVRKPIGVLPSGAKVLGMADVVVLNDPLTGQGSNNASKCASSYLASILEQEGRPFDAEFMSDTFERYWDNAKYATRWTDTLLAEPVPHIQRLMGAGNASRRLARRYANAVNEPRDFFLWLMDADSAHSYLEEIGLAESGRGSAQAVT